MSSEIPDLASILKTLAGLNPQNLQQPTPHAQHQALPAQFEQTQNQQPWQQTQMLARSTTPTYAPQAIDPATIVEWSAGLRCVMKAVAMHENIVHEIRRMIKVQHEHEQQWWRGREALIERQRARKEGQKKLDDVLKAVGGTITTGNANNSSPEELAKELETFDMKVYKAQMAMNAEFQAKLRGLGIPFFGTKSELVRLSGREKVDSDAETGTIDEAELVRLQRKMLEILEDLCKD